MENSRQHTRNYVALSLNKLLYRLSYRTKVSDLHAPYKK